MRFDVTLKTNEHGKKHSLGPMKGENYSKDDARSHALTFLWTVCCLHPEEAHNCSELSPQPASVPVGFIVGLFLRVVGEGG